MIAGLPPIYGLYSAMILPVIAGLFGSSRHLISGPTTAISIVVFAAISEFAEPGSQDFISKALILTLIAGIFQLVFGLVRLGALVNFVSHTVVIGFTSGAAVLIFTSQLNNLAGISRPKDVSFFESIAHLTRHISDLNIQSVILGSSTLLLAILIKRLNRKLPNLLISMILGSLLAYVMGADVALVGELPKGLPPLSIPKISQGGLQDIIPSAFAIALLGLIEAVAIARSIATKSGQRLDANQEFIGQGLSNIVGSFFSSYAGSGSFTRSGVNYDAGARTPVSAILAALFLALVMLFVAPLAAYLPISVMAGIILVVAYNLVDFRHMWKILKSSKRESTVLLITLSSTLTLDLEYAIYLGVMFSLIFYLQRTSTPRLVHLTPNPKDIRRRFLNAKRFPLDQCPQLKIVRIEGSLFFGAVHHIEGEMKKLHKGPQTHLLIVGNGINLIDTSGIELLQQEAKLWEAKGGGIYFSGIKRRARITLNRGGFFQFMGAEHFFDNKEKAIAAIYEKLDQDICRDCRVKIFRECPGN